MTLSEKLRVAKALSELKVDIIEAGFPAASPGDFESVKAIADRNFGPVICGLARCNAADIEKVYAAVKGADKHRIHVFVATSAIHREHKLKMAKEEIIKSAVGAIKMARELCRRRGVLAGGCVAHRAVVPGRSGVRRDRSRRDDCQYSGHGGLYRAGRVRSPVPLPEGARRPDR